VEHNKHYVTEMATEFVYNLLHYLQFSFYMVDLLIIMLILILLLPWKGTNDTILAFGIRRLEIRFSLISLPYKQIMTYLSSKHAVISVDYDVDIEDT